MGSWHQSNKKDRGEETVDQCPTKKARTISEGDSQVIGMNSKTHSGECT